MNLDQSNNLRDNIYALSSGSLPSGLAVIRFSGPDVFVFAKTLGASDLEHQKMRLVKLYSPIDNDLLDEALVCGFRSPHSFTGEDVVEFHLHGGKAVVEAFLTVCNSFDNSRIAEAGEFTRRALENNKLNLLEVEGLSDLIASDTELQRRQALLHTSGKTTEILNHWRENIVRARSYFEAEFDFSDEGDVPGSMRSQIGDICKNLIEEISVYVDDERRGEIIRDGFRVALMGPPNAGKSSLLNCLAKRDVAIVSDIAGTTRDVLEVRLDLFGVPVMFFDTAGLRDTEDKIELLGIDRAIQSAEKSDLVLWLSPVDDPNDPVIQFDNLVVVNTKIDLRPDSHFEGVSINSSVGLEHLYELLGRIIKSYSSESNKTLITTVRHRNALVSCLDHLREFLNLVNSDGVLAAEVLRLAGDSIGSITGHIDVEDLLDVIFSEFCVGK